MIFNIQITYSLLLKLIFISRFKSFCHILCHILAPHSIFPSTHTSECININIALFLCCIFALKTRYSDIYIYINTRTVDVRSSIHIYIYGGNVCSISLQTVRRSLWTGTSFSSSSECVWLEVGQLDWLARQIQSSQTRPRLAMQYSQGTRQPRIYSPWDMWNEIIIYKSTQSKPTAHNAICKAPTTTERDRDCNFINSLTNKQKLKNNNEANGSQITKSLDKHIYNSLSRERVEMHFAIYIASILCCNIYVHIGLPTRTRRVTTSQSSPTSRHDSNERSQRHIYIYESLNETHKPTLQSWMRMAGQRFAIFLWTNERKRETKERVDSFILWSCF